MMRTEASKHTDMPERGAVPVRRLLSFGGLVGLTLAGGHHLVPGPLLEAVLFAALIYALAGFGPLRRVLVDVPRRYRTIALVFVVLLAVGQVIKGNEYTFPFVGWTMYGTPHPEDPVFYEYTAIRQSGRAEPFDPPRLVPTLANARIDNRLKRQIETIEKTDDPATREREKALHAATLRAFARLADAGSADPIVAVQVTRGTVPLRAYSGDEALPRTPLWRIDTALTP